MKVKTAKTFLIIPIILSILQPTIILSKMPPDSVIRRKQGTEVIVIGEVYDQGAALLVQDPPEKPGKPPLNRFIVLKVVYVIKGDWKIKPNNLIHILCQGDPEKQNDLSSCLTEGIPPVQSERGALVIAYAETLPNNPGFYSNRAIFPFITPIFFIGLF